MNHFNTAVVFAQFHLLWIKLCLCVWQDDQDFRDKITPISVVMEYSLDYQQAADKSGLLPILDMLAPSNVTKQVEPPTVLKNSFTLLTVSTRSLVLCFLYIFFPSLRLTSCWTVETITSVNPTSGCQWRGEKRKEKKGDVVFWCSPSSSERVSPLSQRPWADLHRRR